jgi:hypothetical protein
MAPINSYRGNPLYPDRYTEASNWVRVLPVPGRALQTSEIMEVQSILHGQVRMALSSIYRDGSPISGLRVLAQTMGVGLGPTYTITSGMFYIQGMTIPVEGVSSFTPGPTNTVYVLVSESILTEVDTPSLRDPLRGQYGLEGAHRLVWTASISANPGPSSYPIATISTDGQVIQRPTTSPDGCLELLAAYTRDRMGDFLLHGLLVTYGGSKQSVSTPLTTYKRGEVERLNSELLEYNTLLSNSGTELSRVRVELEAAIVTATQSPSAPNRFVVDTRRKRVEELEAIMASLTSEVGAITAQLAAMSSTIPLRELLNISPGVAYVHGYRIEKASATTLEVPRTNTVEEVEAAKFTYVSSPATSNRTLLPSGLSTDGGQVSLAFTGIPYQAGYISITATYSWGSSSRPLYDLVEAFQRGQCIYTSNASLLPTTLREALLRVISVVLSGPNTLLITSQYRDSLIGLGITSNRYEVDVGEGYLIASSPHLNSYELGRKPVSDIVRVVADLEATLLPITRAGSRDSLGDDTVYSIKEVVQGTQRYQEGRDYTLYGQGWIEWRPQVGPAIGTTYLVTYLYTQPLTKGVDYRLVGDRVELINSTRRPAPGQTFTVDYTYSLPQMGRVFIDRNGVIGYTLSPPSVDPVPPLPSPHTLSLCTFTMVRDRVIISDQAVRRLSVADLGALLRQYRQREVVNALPLPQVSVGSEVSITPTYITTPTRYMNVPLKYLGGGHIHGGHHLTLPYSSKAYLEQGRVTGTHTLSPRPTPQIYIHPQVVTHTEGSEYSIQPCGRGHTSWEAWVPATAQGTGVLGTATPTASPTVHVVAVGLDDRQVYAVMYAGREVPYTVVVGSNTTSGIKPTRGKVEVYISIITTPPGSYRVELKPLSPTSMPAVTSLTVIHPPYRHIGIDKTVLPNGLAVSHVRPPLSQTVMVPEDIYLSSIAIAIRYIEPGAMLWLTVETLGEVSRVLGMGVMGPPLVSSEGEELTRIVLEHPIYLEGGTGYQLCVYVQGGEVDLYTATLGERDLRDGAYIGGQLLHLGELSLSDDGVNVLPMPEDDLTHVLYAAHYLTNPVVVSLGTYGLPDLLTPITAFCINGEDSLPPGTSILYEYKADSIWRPCTRDSVTCMPAPTSSITLRATMYTSKASITPLLLIEGVTVTIYSNSETGMVRGGASGAHNRVRLSFIKGGTQGTITPSVSVVEGVWINMVLVGTSPVGDELRYVYEATVGRVQQSEYRVLLWDRPYMREVIYELL